MPREVWIGAVVGAASSYASLWALGGGITGTAALTALVALYVLAVAPAMWLPREQRAARLPLTLCLWLGWAVASLVWADISVAAVQNLFVYVGFLGIAALVGAGMADKQDVTRRALRLFSLIGVFISLVFLAQVLKAGAAQARIAGARGFALEAAILVGPAMVYARTYRAGLLRFAPLVLVLAVLVSLSRTATAVAVVLFVAGWAVTSRRSRGSLVRFLVAITLGLYAFRALINSYAPLRDRFIGGDGGSVGGIAVNTEGRQYVWRYLWATARDTNEHALFGRGVGAAADESLGTFGARFPQPHNDYLRLLYDFGWVGLALFSIGMLVLLVQCFRAARTDPEHAPAHHAAGLALLGVLAAMTTDNVLVYPFCMIPVGVLVGLSLAHQRQAATQTVARVPSGRM